MITGVLGANRGAPVTLVAAPTPVPTLLIVTAAADAGEFGIAAMIVAEDRAAMDKSLVIGISAGLRGRAQLRAKLRSRKLAKLGS